ncbi:MAG: DUF3987 domain-containing protein [Planctomycetaceae bacterium]|nr:DUF3987 domain-containing protein [Planctomycetaceae bacterium]
MKLSPIDLVLSKLSEAKQTSSGGMARCPAHEDRSPSLSISEGDDGRVLLHCHAGCKTEDVVSAIGLKMADLMPPERSKRKGKVQPASNSRRKKKPQSKSKTDSTVDGDRNSKNTSKPTAKQKTNGKRQIVATYDYCDEEGNLQFQVIRFEPKGFRQRRPKEGGGWDWSVKGVRVVPYRLPELLAEPQRPIFVVEGEKDADNLAKIDILATCNAGGAGKWTAEHAKFIGDRQVIVIADNDEPGRKHAEDVARSLAGRAAGVRLLNLTGLGEKGDISDWIEAGGTKEQLRELAESSEEWQPPSKPEEWEKIKPFDHSDLPPFPTGVLPDDLREWVEAESHATQTPPDLAALLSLAVLSSTIARRVTVEPRTGWKEPVNLFVACLLGSGNRKSAVFNDAIGPLREVESEQILAAGPDIARLESTRRQDESRLKKLEKTAATKHDNDSRCKALDLAAELDAQTVPAPPRLIVDDATSEKLGMMLAEQNGRIASMSPEGGEFDLMAGLYAKSGLPQFGVYLMGHSGDDLITDRVTRKTVRVERPALTCAYAMQPQVIEGLAENPAFRGRGLLARFLYAAPESWVGERKIAPTPVSESVKMAYRWLVRKLALAEEEFTLQLTSDADKVLFYWEGHVEEMLGDGGDMELTRDWGAKLAGATLRMAAVIHCVKHGLKGRIDAETIQSAIKIAMYLIPHAEFVLDLMAADETDMYGDLKYVMKWIKRHDKREFTKRDVHQHGKRKFKKAEDINPVLAELEKRNYIRGKPQQTQGKGRRPSPAYEVNPAFFESESTKKRSQNSQKPADEQDTSISGNNGSASEKSENTERDQVTI